MATFRAYFDANESGLSSQTLGNGIVYSGRSANFDVPPQWQAEQLIDVGDDPLFFGARVLGAVAQTPAKYRATEHANPHDTWFELIHVLPRGIVLGLITADDVVDVEIYNAWRVEPRVFSAFVNGAGEGVFFLNLPSLPATIQEQDSLDLDLQVLAGVGPPIVDADLEYVFDVVTILEGISLERAVIFPFEPEAPVIERLSFLTDVLSKRVGKEQRVSLRAFPRQSFDMSFRLEGHERRLFESIVFDAQARPLGVPVWFEPALLTAAVSPGNTVLPVDSTNFADHRAGSFVILFESTKKFEVQTTSVVAPTSITVGSPLLGSFPVGTRVMPVRICFASANWRGSKAMRNSQLSRVTLDVLDNEVDLSDATPFLTFAGKVLLDEPNWSEGQLGEAWERDTERLDSETGLFVSVSDWDVSRRSHQKTFFSRTRQRLWQVRRLLHHLRGMQTSFYIPTFYDELVPVADIGAGASTVDVENVGYSKFVASRQARNVVQVVKTDGTKLGPVTVTGAVELSADVERLTVTPTWSGAATVAEVLRVEYLEKVRMDSDEATIEHASALGEASIKIPVKAVLD